MRAVASCLEFGGVSSHAGLGAAQGPWLGAVFEDLVLERPHALWLLALPLLLWISSTLPARAVERATGTLAWWRRLTDTRSSDGGRRRRRTPPATWLAVLSLVAGSVALAGPHGASEELSRRWRCVVDTRPAMGLAPAPLEGGSPQEGDRVQAATARAVAVIEAAAASGDSVLWIRRGRDPLELPVGVAPPADWLRPGGVDGGPAPWDRFDEPGCLWVTDLPPEVEPTHAGWVASGARPAPGPIARTASGWLLWDGEGTSLDTSAGGAGRVALRFSDDASARGQGDGGDLASLFAIWAEQRGLRHELATPNAAQDDFALVLEVPSPQSSTVRWRAGKDHWRVEGPGLAGGVSSAGMPGDVQVWLAAESAASSSAASGESRVPLVVASPGRIRAAWSDWELITGDTVELALAFSRLFEAHLLLPDAVVPLAERVRDGAAAVRRPKLPLRADSDVASREPVASNLVLLLAGAAALLALLACSLGFGLGVGQQGTA